MRLPAGRGPPQRAHLFAGGVSRPSVGQLAGRHTRLAAGRGPMHLIAGAVYARHGGQRAAADSESGARAGPRFTVTLSTAAGGPQRTPSRAPGPGPRSHCHTQHGGQRAAADSESGARAGAPIPLSHSARRPAGRSGLRVGRPGRGPDPTVTLSTAASGPLRAPSRAPGSGPRLHCQPADGPRGQPQPPRAGPGPRQGRDSDSQPARAVRQSVGPSVAGPRAAGAVSLDGGGRQSGRCGVLTRIRVGAAAAAGTGRHPGPCEPGPGRADSAW